MVANGQTAKSPGKAAETASAKTAGRMPAALRHARIIAAFDKHGFVSISDLSVELNVSGMTVRRDLDLLGKRGLLTRTHGGAVPNAVGGVAAFDSDEPAFEQRMRVNPLQKSSIAQAAANLVGAGESLGLDVGTSVLSLAQILTPRRDLRVFTNSLRVGMQMAEGNSTIYVLGGQVRVPEYSMIGAPAVEGLKSHFLDKVFIGVSGIDAEGLYDYSPEDSEVKRAFIANAGQVIVLCDSSKFSRRALTRIAPLDKISTLITETEPPADLALALTEAGVEIIVAPSTPTANS